MIQRIICALSLCLLLFIPFHDIMAGELVTRDSLNNTTDTLKNGFFHRLYRYFEQSNKVKEEKKFDFSIIGGPHFSSDTKLGLGVVASGLFRIDREDKTISPSNISLYGDVTTTGFYLLGIRGNMIFPKDRFRANINMYFFSFPSEYWGIGYDAGKDEDHKTEYKRLEQQVKLELLYKLAPNLYAGANLMFRNVTARNFDDITFLNGAKKNVNTFGPGLVISDMVHWQKRHLYLFFHQKKNSHMQSVRYPRHLSLTVLLPWHLPVHPVWHLWLQVYQSNPW